MVVLEVEETIGEIMNAYDDVPFDDSSVNFIWLIVALPVVISLYSQQQSFWAAKESVSEAMQVPR